MRARLGRVSALAAVCLGVAFAGASPAAYATGTAKCQAEIFGAGSSLQNFAQKDVWIETGSESFLAPGEKWKNSICETKPTKIEYQSTSSGKAVAQWGANSGKLEEETGIKFPTYLGSDVGPEGPSGTSGTQLNNMDKAGGQGTKEGEGVVTVPVAQSAVGVLVQIPEECKGTLEAGEVVRITSEKLEKEWFKNEIKWEGLVTGAEGGKSKCTTEPKVPALYGRASASGTTAGMKRFLAGLNSGTDKTTWATFVSTAAKSESPSEWPTVPVEECAATKVKFEKGSQLAEGVYGCESSKGAIGYADLTDAIKAGFEKEAKLEKSTKATKSYVAFVQVQNNSYGSSSPTYVSPEKSKASNCTKAKYFKEKTLATKGNEDWSGAKQENSEEGVAEDYPVCTLTFDVAWSDYKDVPELPNKTKYNEEQANAVYAYLHYIVIEGQGSPLTNEHYGALPEEVKKSAKTGLEKSPHIIAWE